MLPAANCVSFRSIIESMLPWASLKNASGQTGAGDRSVRSKDIFSVMVTPDRIPKFFIPSLDVHVHSEQPPKAEEGCPSPALLIASSEEGRSPSENKTRKERIPRRGSLRAGSPESCGNRELDRAADHSDPATRAALSMPHFQKITTPYGFPALGEIPHIRRKESLFFERDAADIRSFLKSRKQSRALSRSRSSSLSDPKLQKPLVTSTVARASRSAPWETIHSPVLPLYPAQAPNSLSRLVKDKNKFQVIINKHLASIKRMRSRGSSDRERCQRLSRRRSQPDDVPGPRLAWCTDPHSLVHRAPVRQARHLPLGPPRQLNTASVGNRK